VRGFAIGGSLQKLGNCRLFSSCARKGKAFFIRPAHGWPCAHERRSGRFDVGLGGACVQARGQLVGVPQGETLHNLVEPAFKRKTTAGTSRVP
jgi:hypothetical protein